MREGWWSEGGRAEEGLSEVRCYTSYVSLWRLGDSLSPRVQPRMVEMIEMNSTGGSVRGSVLLTQHYKTSPGAVWLTGDTLIEIILSLIRGERLGIGEGNQKRNVIYVCGKTDVQTKRIMGQFGLEESFFFNDLQMQAKTDTELLTEPLIQHRGRGDSHP